VPPRQKTPRLFASDAQPVAALYERQTRRQKHARSAVIDRRYESLAREGGLEWGATTYNNYLVFSTTSLATKTLTYGYFGRIQRSTTSESPETDPLVVVQAQIDPKRTSRE
jgi:hypothetical protein